MSINREREGCTDEVGGWREGWRYEWPENNGMAGKDGWTEGVGLGGEGCALLVWGGGCIVPEFKAVSIGQH